MSNDKIKVFHEIQDIVDSLNEALDKALSNFQEGRTDGGEIDEITSLISQAHDAQIKLQGYS